MIKNKKIQDLLLILFLFLGIYTPNIFFVQTKYIIIGVSFVFIFVYLIKYKKIVISKKTVYILVGFVPFCVYMFITQMIRGLFNTVYFNNFISTIFVIFTSFLMGFSLVCIQRIWNISFERFLKLMVMAIIIQFACVILAFLVPSIRDVFLKISSRFAASENVLYSLDRFAYRRSYGLSSNLFDLFGYISSLLISFMFLIATDNKKTSQIIVAISLIFVQVLNSRTGILLTIVGYTIVIMHYFEMKRIIRYFFIIILSFITISFIINHLPEATMTWINNGMNDTLTFLSGEKTGAYSELFQTDFVFPPDIFFGAGGSPKNIAGIVGIDSGYVNYIWSFGIFGTILLFYAYYNMYRVSFNSTKEKKDKCMMLIIIVLTVLFLFKISAFSFFGSNIIFYGIPFLICNKECIQVETD